MAPAAAKVAAAPLTPQRNSQMADDDHYLVLRETRDPGWADKSEAALRAHMRSLAYVEGSSLAVQCTTTICEVSGMAIEDRATGSMAPVWEALDRDSSDAALGTPGLARAATTFGTGRIREEFVIHYRRVAAPGGG